MKRSGPLKRRTRLRAVSAKRAVINKARGEFVREQLDRRPHCEAARLIATVSPTVHCLLFSTELHEPLTRGRAPGAETILDVGNSVSICRWCHDWTHSHPALATSIGLLRSARP